VTEYLRLARDLPREEFLARCKRPVLLLGSFDDDDSGFQTLEGGRADETSLQVIEVFKRSASNAFTSMITIGRARNNDVVVPHRSVSKFHAYLVEEGGARRIVDAESTYGTRVRGDRLRPHQEKAPIASGDRLHLGKLGTTFYEAEDFHAALVRELEAGASEE